MLETSWAIDCCRIGIGASNNPSEKAVIRSVVVWTPFHTEITHSYSQSNFHLIDRPIYALTMLSFLLQAAVLDQSHQPTMLCPPCHAEEAPATVLDVSLSLLKSLMSVLVIVYPLYKTFKAWESNRLTACRSMLAYWSAMTLLNVVQGISEELIGQYISVKLSKVFCLCVKALPMILGPDRIYAMTLRQFFENHEQQFDLLVTQAHQQKTNMIEQTKPMMEAVNQQMKESLSPVLHSIQESLSPVLQSIHPSKGSKDDLVKPLQPEEAYEKDQVFEAVKPSTESSGLKQRRKRASDNLSIAQSQSEIQEARAADVLTEKIVWGHGLMAKNEEAHRQQAEKESVKQSIGQSIEQDMAQGRSVYDDPSVKQSVTQSKMKVKLPVAAPIGHSSVHQSVTQPSVLATNQTISKPSVSVVDSAAAAHTQSSGSQLMSPVSEPPYIVFHGENDKVDPSLLGQSNKSAIKPSDTQTTKQSFTTIPLDSNIKTSDSRINTSINQPIMEGYLRKEL